MCLRATHACFQDNETFRKQTLAAVNAEVQAEREQLRATLLAEMRDEMKAEMREQRQTETAELEKQLDAEETELAASRAERAARVAKDKDILAQLEVCGLRGRRRRGGRQEEDDYEASRCTRGCPMVAFVLYGRKDSGGGWG